MRSLGERSWRHRTAVPVAFKKAYLAGIVLVAIGILSASGVLAGTRIVPTVSPQLEVYAGAGDQSIGKAEGTASRVAYDPNHNRFLVVWYDWRDSPNNGTWGRLINGDGTAYGDAFAICTSEISQHYNPTVAFDSANQRFLVVWADNRSLPPYGQAWRTFGQFVAPDGSLQGSEFIISGNEDLYGPMGPTFLTYSTPDQRFLVLLLGGSGSCNLYGRFVKADGGLVGGGPFPITDIQSGYGVWRSTAAYDSNNNRFLVAYGDSTAGQTCARLVGGDGSVGPEIVLNPVEKQLDGAAFDPVNSRFLVLWERMYGDFSSDVYDQGHLFNADGSPYGSQITILPGDLYGSAFDVAFDIFNQKFMVVGTSTTKGAVFGQLLNLDTSLCGAPFTILDQGHMSPIWPYVSYGCQSSGALVFYGDAPVPENGADLFANLVKVTMQDTGLPFLPLLLD